MTERCDTCGVTAVELGRWGALLYHSLKFGKRLIEWCTCLTCELKEMRG